MAREPHGTVMVYNITDNINFFEKFDGHPFFLPPGHCGWVNRADAELWFGDPNATEEEWQKILQALELRNPTIFPAIQRREIGVKGWNYRFGYSSTIGKGHPSESVPISGEKMTEEEIAELKNNVVTGEITNAAKPTVGFLQGSHGAPVSPPIGYRL